MYNDVLYTTLGSIFQVVVNCVKNKEYYCSTINTFRAINEINEEVKLGKSTGKIKFFNSQKGFGFITPDDGGKDLFVHTNNVLGDARSLREGQSVEYVEGAGRKGPEATEVSVL